MIAKLRRAAALGFSLLLAVSAGAVAVPRTWTTVPRQWASLTAVKKLTM
jgi:hypothetical protein